MLVLIGISTNVKHISDSGPLQVIKIKICKIRGMLSTSSSASSFDFLRSGGQEPPSLRGTGSRSLTYATSGDTGNTTGSAVPSKNMVGAVSVSSNSVRYRVVRGGGFNVREFGAFRGEGTGSGIALGMPQKGEKYLFVLRYFRLQCPHMF